MSTRAGFPLASSIALRRPASTTAVPRFAIPRAAVGRVRVLVDDADLIGRSSPSTRPIDPPINPDHDRAPLLGRLVAADAERERLTADLVRATDRAGKAEGQVQALRDALADLADRLDRAEARLAMPWWRRLIG